jgi:hypothetical protein
LIEACGAKSLPFLVESNGPECMRYHGEWNVESELLGKGTSCCGLTGKEAAG